MNFARCFSCEVLNRLPAFHTGDLILILLFLFYLTLYFHARRVLRRATTRRAIFFFLAPGLYFTSSHFWWSLQLKVPLRDCLMRVILAQGAGRPIILTALIFIGALGAPLVIIMAMIRRRAPKPPTLDSSVPEDRTDTGPY